MKVLTYDETKLHNTAIALGKFQGIHKGHLLLIDKIIELAEKEGLTSVVFTININNSKMINTREDRYSILENLGIDLQIECEFSPEFAAMKPHDFIKNVIHSKLGAKYVVVGTDFCFGCNREGNIETLMKYEREYGYKVIPIDKLSINESIVSSSLIRKFIQDGRMEDVAAFMGRNYFIQGKVLEGRRIGRTLDFPTVNLKPDKDKLLPPYGAYETKIEIDGKVYKGITNIGDNPTVSNDNTVTVETHIIDYNGDLYGENINVEFIKYIRKQKRFKDVNELRKQLLLDKASVMHQ